MKDYFFLTNGCFSLTNDYICTIELIQMIMWLIVLIVPFISLLIIGYLVYEAPVVSNDLTEV